MSYFSVGEREYMNYLDEVTGIDGYGLLMLMGDPIQFSVGFYEWEIEDKNNSEVIK